MQDLPRADLGGGGTGARERSAHPVSANNIMHNHNAELGAGLYRSAVRFPHALVIHCFHYDSSPSMGL